MIDQIMMGPLGQYDIAKSLVDRIGYNPLEAANSETPPDGGRGGGGSSFGFRLGMSDEDRVRAYGYEGPLSEMQDNLPPSLRGVYSSPNAGVMLGAAAKNVESGLYANMQEAMDAQIAFNQKYPGYGIAENENLVRASHQMVRDNDQSALKQRAANQATIRNQGTASSLINANQGQAGSWTPGGSYAPMAPLAKASTASRYTGGRGRGGGSSSYSAPAKSYANYTPSFNGRGNLRGL